ncbi:MAG: ABC transporter permease [Candidatus Dormibacteraeota bacterium]|nr:ABC transporter permease [Candidatus Dormibacteraeota bacterium]
MLRTGARNPVATFGLFAILMLLVLGVKYLDSARASPLKVAVADQAHTQASADLARTLRDATGITVTDTTEAQARSEAAAGTADLALIDPPGFGQRAPDARLQPANVTVVYTAGTQGQQGVAAVETAVDAVDRRSQAAPRALGVATEVRNARIGLIDLFLPGLLAFNVIQSGLMVAASTFAGYRSGGVLRRVQATGIAPSNLVLAHATASLAFGALQLALMIGLAAILFPVHIDGLALFLVTMLGYLVFLAAGFAIAGWIRDAQRAPAVATAVGMPMIFIGLLPVGLLPGAAAAVVGILPVSFVTHASRALIAGAGLGSVGGDLLWLSLWAAALLVAASRAFRWDGG